MQVHAPSVALVQVINIGKDVEVLMVENANLATPTVLQEHSGLTVFTPIQAHA